VRFNWRDWQASYSQAVSKSLHWEKSRENFGKILYVSQNVPIFSLKMGELFAHFEKKMEKFRETCKKFPMIFPSV